jgi:disulfide oxidoreductase YuzD
MRLENSGAEEWAFYGWFKFDVPEKMPNLPITVLRVVYNDPRNEGELNMAKNIGDQAFAVYITTGNIDFCTGKSGESIADEPEPNFCVSSPYGNDLEEWIWFYVGYNRKEQQLRYFVRYDDHNWEGNSQEVFQVAPHWSGVFIAGDPFFRAFKGRIRNVEALYGPRAFIAGSLDALIEESPP